MNDYYYYERAINNRYARTCSKRRVSQFNRRVIMVMLFLIILIFAVFSIRLFTYAKDSSEEYKKQYRSVTIFCGDTVESIAAQNMGCGYSSENSLIREICSINNISSGSDLTAGNHLIIPYYERY